MGSVRPRAETGKLFIDFRYGGVRCREQTLLDDTATNRNRLEKLLDKIEGDISLGVFDYAKAFPNSPRAKVLGKESLLLSGIPLLSEFADEWFEENAFRWKRSGKINTRNILEKHLLPRFGATPVSAIPKGDILKFRAALAELPGRKGEKLSPKRINNIMQPFKSIMDEAAERYIFPSPFQHIKPLRGKKSDVQPFSLAEVFLILDRVREILKFASLLA